MSSIQPISINRADSLNSDQFDTQMQFLNQRIPQLKTLITQTQLILSWLKQDIKANNAQVDDLEKMNERLQKKLTIAEKISNKNPGKLIDLTAEIEKANYKIERLDNICSSYPLADSSKLKLQKKALQREIVQDQQQLKKALANLEWAKYSLEKNPQQIEENTNQSKALQIKTNQTIHSMQQYKQQLVLQKGELVELQSQQQKLPEIKQLSDVLKNAATTANYNTNFTQISAGNLKGLCKEINIYEEKVVKWQLQRDNAMQSIKELTSKRNKLEAVLARNQEVIEKQDGNVKLAQKQGATIPLELTQINQDLKTKVKELASAESALCKTEPYLNDLRKIKQQFKEEYQQYIQQLIDLPHATDKTLHDVFKARPTWLKPGCEFIEKRPDTFTIGANDDKLKLSDNANYRVFIRRLGNAQPTDDYDDALRKKLNISAGSTVKFNR